MFRKIFTLLILLISVRTVHAQERTITGKVVDETNLPLPGVVIKVSDANTGTTTDVGATTLLPFRQIARGLFFNYVGYDKKEVTAGTQTELNVSLTTTKTALNEVVVVGYGTTRKRDLTGAVYSVKADDITRLPTFNPIEAIQGRVPGADITRSSGAAGAGANITVRGNRTIGVNGPGGASSNNGPLYVIDGFQGGSVSDINPNDIESIEVLKDASSTAIYGALGANGVIIITTKKGKSGKPSINYSGYYGINELAKYPKPRTGDDFLAIGRTAAQLEGQWNSPADDGKIYGSTAGLLNAIQNNQNVDWFNQVVHKGIQQSHTASVSGGNDNTKAFFSAGYFNEKGIYENDNFKRISVRMNVDQKIGSWVTAGVLSQVTYSDRNQRTDPLSIVNSAAPFGTPYDANGDIAIYPLGTANRTFVSPLTDERPNTAQNNTIRTNVMANGYVEVKPLPIKGLTFRSNFGSTFDFSRQGIFNSATSLQQRTAVYNSSTVTTSYSRYYNWDNILTYDRSFGDHKVTATALSSYIQNDVDGTNTVGIRQPVASQSFYGIGGVTGANLTSTVPFAGFVNYAYAARVNYSYKGKYLLSLSQRYDGASRLSDGKKWSSFPSVGLGWNIMDEGFMKNLSFINNLKLRGTYGTSGNYTINIYGTQSTLTNYPPMTFGGDAAAIAYYFNSRIGNTDLMWETSTTANFGLDFGLFNNRISGAVDVYQTNTKNILLLRSLPLSSGVSTVYDNIGATRNKGIELSITSQNIKGKEFNWNTTATFTRNIEQITELPNGQDVINAGDPESSSLLLNRPINSFYTYEKLGIWQTDEAAEAATYKLGTLAFKPGDIKLKDQNGDHIIDAQDRVYLGSTVPQFFAGLQNNFSYKGIDLGIYVVVRWGQMIDAEFLGRYDPSGRTNSPADINYWTPTNPTNDFPAPVYNGSYASLLGNQTLTFVDGSYIKLKNISLGYTLPAKWTGGIYAQKIRVYATVANIFTWSPNHLLKNYDPERGGSENSPLTRQFVFGLNANF